MSAGSIIGTAINIFAVGLLCGVIGYIIDFIRLQSTYFTMNASTLLTLHYITLAFYAFPFIYFFALIVHHIIISINEQTGMA